MSPVEKRRKKRLLSECPQYCAINFLEVGCANMRMFSLMHPQYKFKVKHTHS